MNKKNLYQILGVANNANPEEIKRAYRKMVFELHPDRNPNYDEKLFFEVKKAYEILSDAEKRKSYDNFIKRRESFVNTIKTAYEKKETTKKETSEKREFTLFLTLEEMYKGKIVPVTVFGKNMMIKIPEKSYSGKKLMFCTEINSTPIQIVVTVMHKKSVEKIVKDNGDVYMDFTIDSNTAALGGTETVKTPLGQKVEIYFKGGSRNGQIMRLPGLGAYTKNGTRGNLFITINIKAVVFSLKSVFA